MRVNDLRDLYAQASRATSIRDLLLIEKKMKLVEAITYDQLKGFLLRSAKGNQGNSVSVERLVPDGIILDANRQQTPLKTVFRNLMTDNDIQDAGLVKLNPKSGKWMWNLKPHSAEAHLIKFLAQRASPDEWKKAIQAYPKANIGDLISFVYSL